MPPPQPPPHHQRSPPGASSSYHSTSSRSYPVSPSAAAGAGPLPPLRPPSRTSSAMDDAAARDRWRQPHPGPSPSPRSDVMNMHSLLGPPGSAEPSDPRHMMYDRERDRARSDREREWEWERERERERDRARAGPPYAGGPSSRNPPPPNHPNDRRSPNMPYGHVSTSPSSQSAPPRRKWSESDDAASAYHKEREWEREREYELEREREMRWRASQRSGGGPDMQPSQHGRALSGDMRYAVGGPVSGIPGEPNQSPREPYASSLPPRRSPAPGLSNRAGVVGARVREQSADVPLAAMGPESSPRHAPYPGGPYDDPRSGSMPPGHAGGMLPPAGRSPERMRAPLSYGPYDGPMSERELMQRDRDREREREMMAGDRYGRRMHGESMVMDDPYDRYGPRGPPSGPLGPPSSKSASGRPYDERGPPPPLPYPPASPTQSRDGDRRKDKVKQAPTREPSAPAQSRPGGPGGSGPLPSHFEADRHPRSGPPPPMGPSRESSVKLESGPRRAPLSPTSERGALFRDGPQHRGPSIPPYGGPPSDRDIRERDRELALQREREYEAEHERQRLRVREREQREREIELEREREREMDRERERERLRIEELERERQKERERELEREQEREREKEREKEKERERRERRREKQQAEKMAAMEREKEREFQAQAQAQAQAHAAAAAAAGMHPGAIGELPSHMRPPPASLEEALIATAQQQAAAYGRPPNMADFHAAAAAIGYPPGMPLPPAIHPAMFGGGMGPGSEAMVPHQPHVIRDPNAGPRVDSEPVWLYLELCERDESIRRAERLPLDMLAEEQKQEIAAELAGVAPAVAAEQAAPASEDADEASAPAVAAVPTSETDSSAAKQADAAAPPTTAANKDTTVSVAEAPIDPLPRHLIGMDKGRPVRHLGSWIYDPTVDPLFPAELLARNVGSTLEVRIPGDLLSCGSRGGPHWLQYRSLETECLALCQVGDPLKDLLEGERGRVALNGASNNWKLGWRGKEHARMSLEMRIEERIAEAQLFGHKLPGISQESSAREEVDRSEEKKQADGVAAAAEAKSEAETKEGETAGEGNVALTENGVALKTSASGDSVSPWRFWRLNPLLRRKLWGTDVYTDDSDVLAMCVHAGWVEGPSLEAEGIPAWVPPGRAARAWNGLTLAGRTSAPATAAESTTDVEMSDAASLNKQPASGRVRPDISCDLSVILRIAPKLIAYKGCQRGGIKSRSWGNSHDGVSLVVESVELKQPGYAQSKGRKSAKARIDQLAFYRNAVENSNAAKPSSSTSASPSPVNLESTAAKGPLDLKAIMQDTQLIPLSSVVGELKKSSPAVDKEQAEAAKQQRLFWEIQ